MYRKPSNKALNNDNSKVKSKVHSALKFEAMSHMPAY